MSAGNDTRDTLVAETVTAEVKVLRPYQSRLIRQLAEAFGGGARKVALVSPTGSGKSLMVTTLLQRLASAGVIKRAVVVAPQTQIKDSFDNRGIVADYGERKPTKRPRRRDDITNTCILDTSTGATATATFLGHMRSKKQGAVALVCTHAVLHQDAVFNYVKRSRSLRGRLLVVDEAHKYGERSGKHVNKTSEIVNAWLDRGGAVLLVTATPYRRGKGEVVIDDSWRVRQWTIAEHIKAGYAPANLVPKFVTLRGYRPKTARALYNETRRGDRVEQHGGTVKPAFARAIVKHWLDNDCRGEVMPKTVVIVPSLGSQDWARRLGAAFTKVGARVLDATGVDAARKAALREALLAEQGRSFAESQIDVVIACKRFDEGTDWPLCSHVYVVGYPVSIGLTIQRWGRAMRDKSRIADHPFPDVAAITFFAPEWSNDLRKDMEGTAGRLRQHREDSFLLSCFLHDWQTGQRFARAGAAVTERVRGNAKADAVDAFADAMTLTDIERAQAWQDVVKARKKLGLDGPGLTAAQVREVAEVVSKKGDDRRAHAVKVILVEMMADAAPEQIADKLADKVGGLRITRGSGSSLVRRKMRDVLAAVIESAGVDIVDTLDDQIVATAAMFSGETVPEVTERMRSEASELWGEEYERAALGAIADYHAVTSRLPPSDGDASEYGFVSWGAMRQAFYVGTNGMPGGERWHDVCARAIGTEARPRGEMLRKRIVDACRMFYAEHGRRPHYDDGDASRYMGYAITWRGVASASSKLGVSMVSLMDEKEIGLAKRGPCFTIDEIRAACLEFYAKEGRPPGKTSGDASPYFGRSVTWSAAANAARKHGTSLAKLVAEMGLGSARGASRRMTAAQRRTESFSKAPKHSLPWHMYKRGMDTEDLVKKANIPYVSVARYVAGRARPRLGARSRIAKALGLKPDQIKWDAK